MSGSFALQSTIVVVALLNVAAVRNVGNAALIDANGEVRIGEDAIAAGDVENTKEPQPVAKSSINAMQWSSHWRCYHMFPDCPPQVKAMLEGFDYQPGDGFESGFLKKYELDFVNLGMFQDYAWQPPSSYAHIDFICSSDNVRFLYNKEKWEVFPTVPLDAKYEMQKPEDEQKYKDSLVFGCANENWAGGPDRVYAVMAFQRKSNKEKVIVTAGHFPHPPKGTSGNPDAKVTATKKVLKEHIGAKINKIAKKIKGPAKVLLIADLNNDLAEGKGFNRELFNDVANINRAFMWMDPATVSFVMNMRGVVRGADKGLTAEQALLQENHGWITQPIMNNGDVWDGLALEEQLIGTCSLESETDPIGTCCADKPAMKQGGEIMFPYAFDRIMANFGKMTTIQPLQKHFEIADAWSELPPEDLSARDKEEFRKGTLMRKAEVRSRLLVGSFHMPIIAIIKD